MNRSSKIIGCLSLLFILSMPLSAQNPPSRYMILMNDQFATNPLLPDFVYWKKVKGNNVVQVKTSEIPAVEPGAPTSQEIETFMQTLPADKYPTYLLIIGTEDRAAGVEGWYFVTMSGGYTDLYFACRDQADYIPDLFYGRLPATNDDELTTMLKKVLAMDRNPPASDMYNKVVVTGKISYDPVHNCEDPIYCETADAVACYFEQDISNKGYTCVRAIVNTDKDVYPVPDGTCRWNPDGILWTSGTRTIGDRVFNSLIEDDVACSRITDNVNAGTALLLHRDHGVEMGFEVPDYSSEDVRGLTNRNNLPLLLSINCLTGAYHVQDNFAKAWLIHPDGGAYGVIAAVDVSQSWFNDWLTHGMFIGLLPDYRAMHNNSTYPNPDWEFDLPAPQGDFAEGKSFRLGPMLNCGKMYMHNYCTDTLGYDLETFRLFHVFGDPEMEVRLHTPQPITPSYPSALPIGTTSLTVNAGAAGLQVCILGAGYTPEQQTAVTTGNSWTFPIATPATGLIHTTISGMDRRPHEGIIRVGSGLIFGDNKMFIGTDGNAHVPGYQTDRELSGLRFGSVVTVSADQGNLRRTDTLSHAGAWLDVPAHLSGGLVFRAPDGRAYMHIGATGVVTVRNQFTSM